MRRIRPVEPLERSQWPPNLSLTRKGARGHQVRKLGTLWRTLHHENASAFVSSMAGVLLVLAAAFAVVLRP